MNCDVPVPYYFGHSFRLREVGMPADYVHKLARMFQDIKISEDLNQQFKEEYRKTKGSIADSINIKILNAGAWARGSDRVAVSLPLELEDYIPEVEEFYRKKHSGRKLQWHHHMSNGTVRLSLDSTGFSLLFQMFLAILDSVHQRGRQIRFGRDYFPDGCLICLERAAQREDFAGKSASGDRIARCRTPPNTLVVSRLPQVEEAATPLPARNAVAKRF